MKPWPIPLANTVGEDMDNERFLDMREKRRFAAEDRIIARLDLLEAKAEKLVGELIRGGTTVYYINVMTKTGNLTGKTKEFTRHYDAIEYLIRNHYV